MNAGASRWTNVGRHIVLIAGAIIILTPFLYMVGTSFKPYAYVLELPPSFIPSDPTLDNYRHALGSNHFGRYFMNSAVVAVAATAITLLLSSTLAYAFARFEF